MSKKRKPRKKKKTLSQLKKALEDAIKCPKIRTGVQPTKIIQDKTKYSRKEKHKKDLTDLG